MKCPVITTKGRESVKDKNRNKGKGQQMETNTVETNPTTSIITSSINVPNIPIKR